MLQTENALDAKNKFAQLLALEKEKRIALMRRDFVEATQPLGLQESDIATMVKYNIIQLATNNSGKIAHYKLENMQRVYVAYSARLERTYGTEWRNIAPYMPQLMRVEIGRFGKEGKELFFNEELGQMVINALFAKHGQTDTP